MLSKKEIKDIQSLGLKKHRAETGLFVAEGPKIVSELLAAVPGQVKRVLALDEWAQSHREQVRDIPLHVVSPDELQRASGLQTANQVLAVLKQFESKEPVVRHNLCLYLDAIQDPGNFGTIIRIADWFGIKDVVCHEGCADLYNPKVVQSTMASIARVNVWHDRDGAWIKQQKVPILAAVLGGASVYQRGKLKEGILLIGNESKGLQPALLELATEQITIPRHGEAESLNAAVATGIILSHLVG
ncbi:MAG TPA: RNA methyltransferase [Chitinophagaceae bacterium]